VVWGLALHLIFAKSAVEGCPGPGPCHVTATSLQQNVYIRKADEGLSITPESAWLPWLPMPVPQYRFVCITDYRDTFQNSGYSALPPRTQYIAWSHEICPTTGKPHLQVWAYGEKRSEAAWAADYGKSHVEGMMGSILQNDRYISKAAVIKELGLRPMHSGQKRTLVDFTDAIIRDPLTAPGDFAVDNPDYAPTYVQYGRGLEKLSSFAFAKRIKGDHTAPEVVFVYGPPGCGKSRYVRELEPDIYDVPAADGFKWKDGYHAHEAVLFDNISLKSLRDPDQFLKEIDRYPVRVSIKGGFVMWKPKRIYITSIVSPDAIATAFNDPRELSRRITSVIKLPIIYDGPPMLMIEN